MRILDPVICVWSRMFRISHSSGDAEQLRRSVGKLVGKAPWRVGLGHGSFLSLDFGEPVRSNRGVEHGEWHLWLYGTAWRIDSMTSIVAGSEDDRDKLATDVVCLERKFVTSVDVDHVSLRLELDFGDLKLSAFPVHSAEAEHWMLFMPSGEVLVAGPGSRFRWEASS